MGKYILLILLVCINAGCAPNAYRVPVLYHDASINHCCAPKLPISSGMHWFSGVLNKASHDNPLADGYITVDTYIGEGTFNQLHIGDWFNKSVPKGIYKVFFNDPPGAWILIGTSDYRHGIAVDTVRLPDVEKVKAAVNGQQQ